MQGRNNPRTNIRNNGRLFMSALSQISVAAEDFETTRARRPRPDGPNSIEEQKGVPDEQVVLFSPTGKEHAHAPRWPSPQ